MRVKSVTSEAITQIQKLALFSFCLFRGFRDLLTLKTEFSRARASLAFKPTDWRQNSKTRTRPGQTGTRIENIYLLLTFNASYNLGMRNRS